MKKHSLEYATEIGNDIGTDYCNQVSKWIPEDNGSISVTYNGLGWEWNPETGNFSTSYGDPLILNISTDKQWPDGSPSKGDNGKNDKLSRIDNQPMNIYYNIVDASNQYFNFTDTDTTIWSSQPVDDFVTFKAWVKSREDDILTNKTPGCGYIQIADSISAIFVNVGNFRNEWQINDEIIFEVIDHSNEDQKKLSIGTGTYTIKDKTTAIFRGFESVIEGTGDPIVVGEFTDIDGNIPFETKLYQNYPNPFNPTTTINFSLKDESFVDLNIYNYSGQLIKKLINGVQEKGYHNVKFDASGLSTGIYYYTMKTTNKTFTKKMLMIK